MYQNQAAMKEEVLKSYIEQVFNSYDTGRTGNLSANDLTKFFNDMFRSVDVNLTLTGQQAQDAVKAIFPNFSNSIKKQQLFVVFKALLDLAGASQNQNMNANNYNNYNPTMLGNSNGYMAPQNYYNNGNYPQNYMSGYNQNQNYMIQNMLRTGQGLPPGYQHLNINGYGTQNGSNNNNSTSSSTNGSTNGQHRRQ